MAFLPQAFDAADLPQGTGNFDPLPAGWYDVAITGAELKSTKDGNGSYIKVRYDVTGPSHQGRVVFGNLNIQNASAKAEEIGRQQLGEIMRAIGLSRVQDTDQLIGGNLSIKLEVKPADGQYSAGNEVRGFRALAGGSAPKPQVDTPSAPAATRAAPPWAK